MKKIVKGLFPALLILLLAPVTTAFAQVTSPLQPTPTPEEKRDTIILGPTILIDRNNYNHHSGCSLYVPPEWALDYRTGDGDGRTRAPVDSPRTTQYQFEVPATLCEFDESYRIEMEYGRGFACGVDAAISFANFVNLYMYPADQCNCDDPLDHHFEVLKRRNPDALLMPESIMNITDTVINYTDPDTKETLQQLPAKRADIMVIETSSLVSPERRAKVETILYRVIDFADPITGETARDIYVLTNTRPVTSEQLEGTPQAQVALDPVVQQIFDNFRIVVKPQPATVEDGQQQLLEEPPQPPHRQEQQQLQQLQNQGASVSIPAGSSSMTTDAYDPNPVQVSVGDTVTWTNDDSQPHTVTSGENVTPDGNFDSGIMAPAATFEHTFTEAGEYPYFCLLHPNMVGTISVN